MAAAALPVFLPALGQDSDSEEDMSARCVWTGVFMYVCRSVASCGTRVSESVVHFQSPDFPKMRTSTPC